VTRRTYDLDGFIECLELLIRQARDCKLVAASINLDPTGLGHYSYKLIDGTDIHDIEIPHDFDVSDEVTPATLPGRGPKGRGGGL
jgi:hypothetical protein